MESPLRERVPAGTQLIETFRWDPKGGFQHLNRHLARMERSAQALGFAYEEARALYEMQVSGDQPLRCRLTLGEDGFHFSSAMAGETATRWRVGIADQRLQSGDWALAHKTTQRVIYDAARAALPAGLDELLFLNERDEVCEGTITNLFVVSSEGDKLTPPLASGVLPGVQREIQLERGYREAIVTLDMLRSAQEIHMGNSLRGLIPAELV